tara:strand:- start:7280 stop:15004 length:7725 start_codon:yes stop_codon:yes gene_type:complete
VATAEESTEETKTETNPADDLIGSLVDEDDFDLGVSTLAETIKNQRRRALGDDVTERDKQTFLALPNIVKRHSEKLGVTPERFQRAAESQGFNVDRLIEDVGRRGKDTKSVLSSLQKEGLGALKLPEERRKKVDNFYRQQATAIRQQQIADIGSARVISGEKKIDITQAELDQFKPGKTAKSVKPVDFKKVRDPSKRQAGVAKVVYEMGTEAGFTKPQMAAILANGLAESKLDPLASNKVNEDSHGVWQFNRKRGEGKGYTVDQLQDPRTQMSHIIKAVGEREDLVSFKEIEDDEKVLTQEFMVWFEKPKDQSKAAIKGRQAYLGQANRLLDQAAKGSPSSSRREQLEFEKRAEILDIIKSGARSKYRVTTDKEAVGGNVQNEIAAPGTAAYATFDRTTRELTDPKVSSDPERAKIIGAKLAQFSEDSSDSIRETFADNAFQEMMSAGVEYDVGIVAKKLGMTTSAFMAESKDDSSREYTIRQDIIKANIRQVAMYLTTNKLGVPAFVSYEFMDPDNYMQEDRLGPDDGYIPRLFEAASRNRVQLVGLDQKGVPVYRAEGHLDSLFNKLNLHLSMGAGAVDRLLRGPEGESILEALEEGSIKGIKEAKDFTKLMLSTEGARSSGTKAFAYGLGGLAIDILAPDPTIGLAKAASTARKMAEKITPTLSKRINQVKRLAKGDPVLSSSEALDNLGVAAEEMINVQVLVNRAADDFSNGNYADGQMLLRQAQSLISTAEQAEKAVRRDLPEMMRTVDRTDDLVAREVARELPLLRGGGDKKIGESLGFSDFSLRRDYVHPAVERVLSRGGAESQTVGYVEFFGAGRKIDRLIELAAKIDAGDVAGAYSKRVHDEAIAPITEALGKQLTNRGLSEVRTETQKDEVTDLIQSTFNFLRSTEASTLLASSPTDFMSRLSEFVSKFPPGEKKLKVSIMDSLTKTIVAKADEAKKIKAAAEATVADADLSQSLAAVTNSLAGVIESRGAAHAIARKAFADQLKIDVAPVVQKVLTKYEEIGTDKISPVALSFRASLEEAFPAMRGDPALHAARHLDTQLKAIHDRTNEALVDIYADPTRGFLNIIPDFKRKMGVSTTADEAAQVIDEAVELAAEPQFSKLEFGEELLTTKSIREFPPTEGMDFVPGMIVEVKGGNLLVKSIELPEELRGKGLATSLYRIALQKAKKDGLGFSSDLNPDPEAHKIYARLINDGVPFDRRSRMADPVLDYSDVRFVIEKDDLAKVADDVLDVRRPRKADVEDFLTDSQTVVRVMEEAPTVEDLILQINKIARRDLTPDEMVTVVKWLASKGIKVEARGSTFVAEDPEVVEQAEEAFAKAFAVFAKDGPPPTTETTSAFEKARDFVVNSFFSAKKAQADGARFAPSTEIEEVFSNLLVGQKPRYTGAPNIFKAIRRALVDDLPKNTQQQYLLHISQRADRLGHPVSVKELKARVLKAYEEKSKDLTKEVRIELPGPVSLGGLRTKKASASYTLEEWADGAHAFAQKQAYLDSSATKKLAAESQVGAVRELTPTQMIDQYVTDSKPLMKSARFIYLGGDAIEDMRALPPEIRNSIMAGVRITQQSVGETVTLIHEGGDSLVRYLIGDPTVKFKSGRSVLSAGHDMVGSSIGSIKKYIGDFATAPNSSNSKAIRVLMDKLSTGKVKVGDKLVYGEGEQIPFEKAFRKLVFNDAGSMLLTDIFKATGLSSSKDLIEPKHIAVLQSIFEVTGNVKGSKPLTGSAEVFERLYSDIYRHFEVKKFGDAPVANRVAVLLAGHGQAIKARQEWVDLGLVVDAKSAENFKKWIMGEAIDNPDDYAQVQQIFQVHGYNPRFLEAAELDGLNFYVPKMAREKIALALEQATDPKLQAEGKDLFAAVRRGVAESKNTEQMAMAWTTRYLKTRMVRGHFLLKSRYFWMNTMDHFNQMSQGLGFRPALISTMRLIPQTLATNPVGQAALLGIKKAGKDDAGEIMRQTLTSWGDKGADWAASLTRSSKWRGDLNALLEARPGYLMVDGVAYNYADLRRIGVEEGLAASFDTAELGTKIRQVGDMFLKGERKRTGLMKIPGAPTTRDMVKIAEDMAEGWSERERFGAMMTLVEMGVDPRKAARLSIDALYDYAGSMSKADRHWLISIFLPFWAFQKNANRQLIDVVFSPRGAYRLGVLNRAYSKGSDFASEMLYEDMVDPLGFNVDRMNDVERDAYDGLKKALFDKYGVPAAQLPAPLRRQIQLAFSGRSTIFEDGRWYELDSEGLELRESLKKYRNKFDRFYVEKPSRSSMAQYDLSRDAIKVPYAMDEANKIFHDLLSVSNPNRTYTTFLFPEQSYKAAASHGILATSALFAMIDNLRTIGPEYIMNEDDGSGLFTVWYPILEMIQPERALLASDLAASVNLNQSAVPYRVAGTLAKWLDARGFEILPVDAKEDPLSKQMLYDEAMQEFEDGKIKIEPDDPYLNGAVLVPTKRYYISGGLPAMFLKHSPFDELNGYMKKLEESPNEKKAEIRGDLQKWFRTLGIMDVRDVNPVKTAAMEAWQREKEAGGTFEEFKKSLRAANIDVSDYPDEKSERQEQAENIQRKLEAQDKGEMEFDLE